MISEDDYWVELGKNNCWCVYHISMDERPITCFPKKKQALAFIDKKIAEHNNLKSICPFCEIYFEAGRCEECGREYD